MSFEWDEGKRDANIQKHGVDFVLAKTISDGPTVEMADSWRDYGEHRIGAYRVAGDEVLLSFTLGAVTAGG